MLELLIIGFIFWLGYQVGCHLTAWHLREFIMEAAKKEGLVIKDNKVVDMNETPTVYKLFIEKIKDTLYLYDHEDDFVCQALTVEDLAKLAKQYKNIKYAAVLFGEETYMFVDGEVKTKS